MNNPNNPEKLPQPQDLNNNLLEILPIRESEDSSITGIELRDVEKAGAPNDDGNSPIGRKSEDEFMPAIVSDEGRVFIAKSLGSLGAHDPANKEK